MMFILVIWLQAQLNDLMGVQIKSPLKTTINFSQNFLNTLNIVKHWRWSQKRSTTAESQATFGNGYQMADWVTIDWELLFEKWPASWDAFKNHSKRLKTLLNKSFKVSWDTLNEYWMRLETLSNDFPKCLKTLWYLFETSQDAFEWIIRKRLETLSNKYQSVLRHFE